MFSCSNSPSCTTRPSTKLGGVPFPSRQNCGRGGSPRVKFQTMVYSGIRLNFWAQGPFFLITLVVDGLTFPFRGPSLVTLSQYCWFTVLVFFSQKYDCIKLRNSPRSGLFRDSPPPPMWKWWGWVECRPPPPVEVVGWLVGRSCWEGKNAGKPSETIGKLQVDHANNGRKR